MWTNVPQQKRQAINVQLFLPGAFCFFDIESTLHMEVDINVTLCRLWILCTGNSMSPRPTLNPSSLVSVSVYETLILHPPGQIVVRLVPYSRLPELRLK